LPSQPLIWVRALAFHMAFYVWTSLLAIVLLPFAPFIGASRMRRFARFWQRGVQAIVRVTVGLRYRVRGLEHLPPGPVIIAAKHQSAWETLFFHIVRPDIVIGLKHQLRYVPLFGWYLAIAGNIFIDRGGAAAALRSFVRGAKAATDRGWSILIFPEGTRRLPGAPPAYKSGVAALYAALDVPVVPVALNSGLFWSRRAFLKLPGTITVEFLEPIPPGLDRKSFMRLLEERIETRSRELLRAPEDRAAGQ
jgi:1-acyl-sn-glycerol-3-phosphate acyltransferase